MEEKIQEAYEFDFECPKCTNKSMNVESAWGSDMVVFVELYCENCGCMTEEEFE